jgi:hypothetical protein
MKENKIMAGDALSDTKKSSASEKPAARDTRFLLGSEYPGNSKRYLHKHEQMDQRWHGKYDMNQHWEEEYSLEYSREYRKLKQNYSEQKN